MLLRDGRTAVVRAWRYFVGWVGLRLMDVGERIETLGDDLLLYSESERG